MTFHAFAYSLGTLLFLPGCVVWDIRNEMRKTNAHVGAVQESLTATNQRLDGVDSQLSATNQKLTGVDSQLSGTNERLTGTNERLQGTNTSLSGVEEQLALLREINSSMGKLDTHLASLRKSIGAINGMLPFLGLDDAPAEVSTPSGDQPVAAEGAAASDPGAANNATSAPTPTPKREVLVGVWVSTYPDRSRAIIVMADGKYLWSKPDAKGKSTIVERGAWSKDAGTLRLQADGAPAAAPMALMNATSKSFAVQEGGAGGAGGTGGPVWVYVKP